MAARSKARKRALDVLYEADIREQPRMDVLDDHEVILDGTLNTYVRELVVGVDDNRERIDELLALATELLDGPARGVDACKSYRASP